MDSVEFWRSMVTVFALVSLGVNVALGAAVVRYRGTLSAPAAIVAYSLVAAGTNCGSIYFRLRDTFTDLPFNAGDVTVLIPSIGFAVAGVLAWRQLGRIVWDQRDEDC